MKEVQIIDTQVSMDSREIAELTGKDHRKVTRDIAETIGKLPGGVARFGHTYRNEQNGQEYPCFKLPPREVLILISGYSVELRAKIIDRLAELEKKEIRYKLPQTYSEALRALADESEKNAELEAKNAIMLPKAEFYDQVTESKDTIDIGTVSKVLNVPGYGRNRLFEKLREEAVLMGDNIPYQKYVDKGYFRVVELKFNKPDGSTNIRFKTLVFQTGVDFIRRLIIKEGK